MLGVCFNDAYLNLFDFYISQTLKKDKQLEQLKLGIRARDI